MVKNRPQKSVFCVWSIIFFCETTTTFAFPRLKTSLSSIKSDTQEKEENKSEKNSGNLKEMNFSASSSFFCQFEKISEAAEKCHGYTWGWKKQTLYEKIKNGLEEKSL